MHMNKPQEHNNGSPTRGADTRTSEPVEPRPESAAHRPICTDLQARGLHTPPQDRREGTRENPPPQRKGEEEEVVRYVGFPYDATHVRGKDARKRAKIVLEKREASKKGYVKAQSQKEPPIHSGQLLPETAEKWLEWTPKQGGRRTCSVPVREAIFQHHPDARHDGRVLRWIYLALYGTFIDRDTHQRVISWQMLEWVCGEPFSHRPRGSSWNGGRALEYLRSETTLTGLEWTDYVVGERCRTIKADGIHPAVVRAVTQDLVSPPSKHIERVYVLTGERMHKRHGRDARRRMNALLDTEEGNAPSDTSRRIWQHMNAVDARHLNRITEHVPAAVDRVRTRPYDVSIEKRVGESYQAHKAREKRLTDSLRRYHWNVLRSIESQHKPFYRFSSAGRTDRIFGWNRSVLDLPRDVRSILCQGMHNIDLKSAHLCIAASIWQAEEAQERVSDPRYSVWDDLAEHYAPLIERATGDPAPSRELYARIKAALKPAVYSVVYGMPEPNVKGELTKAFRDVIGYDVGSEAGMHFGEHDLMRSLFDARARVRRCILRDGGMRAADGRFIHVNPAMNNPAASVLATVAQSYEQELMSVLVDYETHREATVSRNRFNVLLWLHDGAYVRLRSERARMKDVRKRLTEKAADLGVIAHFDHERVTAPTDAR